MMHKTPKMPLLWNPLRSSTLEIALRDLHSIRNELCDLANGNSLTLVSVWLLAHVWQQSATGNAYRNVNLPSCA
jgi:hypothetical protein